MIKLNITIMHIDQCYTANNPKSSCPCKSCDPILFLCCWRDYLLLLYFYSLGVFRDAIWLPRPIVHLSTVASPLEEILSLHLMPVDFYVFQMLIQALMCIRMHNPRLLKRFWSSKSMISSGWQNLLWAMPTRPSDRYHTQGSRLATDTSNRKWALQTCMFRHGLRDRSPSAFRLNHCAHSSSSFSGCRWPPHVEFDMLEGLWYTPEHWSRRWCKCARCIRLMGAAWGSKPVAEIAGSCLFLIEEVAVSHLELSQTILKPKSRGPMRYVMSSRV